MVTRTILVADDEPHIVELVRFYLERAGFEVVAADDGDAALKLAAERDLSLAILDVMMPGPDGLQVCRALRSRGDLPIVMLTARSSDVDKIAGLRIGADDYVTKPFNPEELLARVEAILRRSANGEARPVAEAITLGDLAIDVPARTVAVAGKPVSLTPREFDLLTTLARFPGTALDREKLLDLVWGTSFYANRTVDIHVARIREKLKQSSVKIETVWGSGYRLVAPEAKAARR